MSKALLSIGFIQILIILVNIGRAKVLSVMIGPAGFGIVSTIDQVVISVVQLGGFAVPFIALKFLSFAHSENHQKFQTAYSSFLSGILALSLIATALLLVILAWKPNIFGSDMAVYSEFLNLALFGVPSLMLGIFFIHTLAAAQKSSVSAKLNFIVVLGLAVATCLGVWADGIRGLYIATVCTGVIITIVSLIFVGRKLNLNVIDKSAGILKELRRRPEIASMALVIHIAVSAYSVALLVTRFIVFSTLGEEQAGLLQALFSIALALGAISGLMNALYLTPLVNRAIPLNEKLDAAHDFQKNITLILTVIALPILLFPKLALFILFSSEFISVSKTVYLFILWQCLFQMVNVYQQLLIGLDDVFYYTVSTTTGYIATIILCSFTIPLYGLDGAAISLISGVFITGLMTGYRLHTKYHSGIPGDLWTRILLCIAGIVVTGVIFSQIEEWSLLGVSIRICFSFAYILAFWFLLSTEQRQYILNLRHKLPF